MSSFIKFLPSGPWRLPVIVLSGIFSGIVIFSVYVSEAFSYLGDKPQTCVNCHIMAPQYATWFHSSHREKTNCNDCHVPHNNVFSNYFFQAEDGIRHATVFTLRKEPQVIFIKEAGSRVVQNNCIRCHSELIKDSRLSVYSAELWRIRTERNCRDCHRETPHGRVNSLSSVPDARVPLPPSPVPEWLKAMINN
ncbi:MAG TPA: cytochrome c nitrite reductase small subunit [Bacteroidales bacterium]|nr:cytochrome c nitrite reductase small subunit [Bacteroidales bacterium]